MNDPVREYFRLQGEEVLIRYRTMNLDGLARLGSWAVQRSRWRRKEHLFQLNEEDLAEVTARLRVLGGEDYTWAEQKRAYDRQIKDPSYVRLIRRLDDVLTQDHCYNCSNNSCDISIAHQEGYILWSAHLFAGATEMTNQFNEAYGVLANKDYEEIQRVLLLANTPHRTCPDCGSLVWNRDGFTRSIACDDCLKELPPWKKRT